MSQKNLINDFEGVKKPVYSGVMIGVVFMLTSEVFWVAMNAMIKYLSDDFSTVQLLFFRNLVPVPAMLILLVVTGKLSTLRTNEPFTHLSVGLIGAAGMAALIFSLSSLSLSQTISITYAAPLMITALSVPMLGEFVGVKRWTGVLVGFLGVVVLARPDAGINPIILLLLASTMCFSVVVILRRRLSKTHESSVIVFYFSSIVVVCAGVFLPWFWHQPSPVEWVLLLIMGTFALGAQFCITQAIRYAPVSVTASLLYVSLVFAVAIDILYWGVTPDRTTMVGAGIIIAAGLYVIYREIGQGKKPDSNLK